MAEFEVLIEEVASVTDHPNADRLSLVGIRGYNCISAKLDDGSHRYKVGDRVVYVPEGAMVPDWLLRKGFWNEKEDKGMLAGSKGNRVKAIKLRDVLSQGILYSVDKFEGYDPEKHFVFTELNDWVDNIGREGLDAGFWHGIENIQVGDDVAVTLGITKYDPPIPASMSGDAEATRKFFKFDIENIKKYPDVLVGHDVVIEEKLHGTCMIAGYDPETEEFVVSSKGLFSKGIVLKDTEENRERNVYWQAMVSAKLGGKLISISDEWNEGRAVFILGEVYGPGVQDLTYSEKEKKFRAFGIRFENDDGSFTWIDTGDKYSILTEFDIEHPPVLYTGPFSHEKVAELTSGKSSLDHTTIREGIVITPKHEFEDRYLGRAILKSVSEEYLLRKGNTTEYA